MLSNRATIGSAESNELVLQGGGIYPIHAQWESLREFRNFQTQERVWLDLGSNRKLGEWELSFDDFDTLWRRVGSYFIEAFKTSLRAQTSLSLKDALRNFHSQHVLNSQMPTILSETLKAHFEEYSLQGPVERLLEDPRLSDVLVQGFDNIWIEKEGRFYKSSLQFSSEETYRIYIQNLLHRAQKNLDEATPFADFQLEDGSRAHVIGPPVTSKALHLSIRKIRQQVWDLEELHEVRMFDDEKKDLIKRHLSMCSNILISGATGSGKTSLLKALLNELAPNQRSLVMEDVPELWLSREDIVFLQTRKDSQGQLPSVSLRELLRQSLRMRPDRLIIGEVRGPEALDLLHAMNTGHRGCMGTLHANSARDALWRLQGLARMAEASLSEELTLDLISRNIHTLIHCAKDSEGNRRIQEMAFVRGLEGTQIVLEQV